MQGSLVTADHKLRRLVRTSALVVVAIIMAVIYLDRDLENDIAEAEQPPQSLFDEFAAAQASDNLAEMLRLDAAIQNWQSTANPKLRQLYRSKWRLQVGIMILLLPLGCWLVFAGARIFAARQYPVPGARVLRDTYVVTNAEAYTAGAIRLVPGVLLIAGISYAVWVIWQHADSVGMPLI